MIDPNNLVNINVKKRTSRVITTVLITLSILVTIAIFIVLWFEVSPGEDWLLALIALLPAFVLTTISWLYITLAKKSLNPTELLEQTFNILSLEIPKALERRLVYYTMMYNDSNKSDGFFKETSQNNKADSLLNPDYTKKLIGDYFLIKSNVIEGLTSCQYQISGKIIEDYPLLKELTIGLQINVSQVEATYTFENLNEEQIKSLIKKTEHAFKGAESAGYQTRTSLLNNNVKFKARMDFKVNDDNANLLLDSCDQLFFVQDFSLMTGSLISLLKGEKL